MESTLHKKMSYIGSFFVTLLLNYVHDKCVFPCQTLHRQTSHFKRMNKGSSNYVQ